MIAVEVKGMDSKYTWGIVGIYRAPHEDMRVRMRNWQPETSFRKIHRWRLWRIGMRTRKELAESRLL
jgi:hypothetical protein